MAELYCEDLMERYEEECDKVSILNLPGFYAMNVYS